MDKYSKKNQILITVLGGWFGLHHYLNKNYKKGILYTLTLGIFYIGWIIDIVKVVKNQSIPNDTLISATNEFKEGNYSNTNNNENSKTKYKKLKFVLLVFCIIGVLSACFGSSSIESFDLDKDYITMDINDTKNVSITTDPEDASTNSLEIKDVDNISASIDDHNIKVKSSSEEGTYKLKIYKDDVNAILTVKVVDKEAQKQKKIEEQKAQEEAKKQAEIQAQEEARKQAEAQAEAQRQAEAQAAAEAQRQAEAQAQRQAAAQASSQSEESSSYTEATAGEVYIPQSGSKYHSNPNCSNMKNPTAVSLSEAQSRGYQPCKKCYR